MTEPLDSDLDLIFQAPADEFVAARNALADRLRKAGDKTAAAAVKALKRPTPAAWMLNQVAFREPALLAQASAATQQLRHMHTRGGHDTRELSAAIEAQRSAMNAVLDAARKTGQNAGLAVEAQQQRKLFTTLQAWLAGGAGERPGRMTQDVDASGFEAVAALGMPAPMIKAAPPPASTPSPASPPTAPPSPRKADAQAIERAAERLAECERRARDAVSELDRRRASLAAGEDELAFSQRSVRDAEATLVKLRAQVGEREAALARMHETLAAAEQAAARARAEEERARTALAALTET